MGVKGYFWTDTVFEMCNPVNVVIQLFCPRDDMSHVGCDTDNVSFFSLGSVMGFGYLWTDTAFKICSPDTCIKLTCITYLKIFSSKYIIKDSSS